MSKSTQGLTKLGAPTQYTYDAPSMEILETFPNQYPKREYVVQFTTEEFTSLCPKTGQPDFANITIRYTPNERCIESKSLKLYLFAFRQHGSFMEMITNKILEDCVTVCQPQWMEVIGDFNVRGGIGIRVSAEYHETN